MIYKWSNPAVLCHVIIHIHRVLDLKKVRLIAVARKISSRDNDVKKEQSIHLLPKHQIINMHLQPDGIYSTASYKVTRLPSNLRQDHCECLH